MRSEIPAVLESSIEERILHVESELIWRGAQVIEYGRWSLLNHLERTAEILGSWGQPARTQLAGLMIRAYVSSGKHAPLFDRTDRRLIADLIGKESENLVHLYSQLAVNATSVEAHGQTFEVSLSTVLEVFECLSETTAETRNDLRTILLAVLAQSAKTDGSPSCWLSTASDLCGQLEGLLNDNLPIFSDCSVRVKEEDENDLVDRYGALVASPFDSHEKAAIALNASVKVVPWVGEPFILLGLFALASGECVKAAEYGERGRIALINWNSPWDKRLSGPQWVGLADFLRTTNRLDGADAQFLARRMRWILENCSRPDGVYVSLEGADALGFARMIPAEVEDPGSVDGDDSDVFDNDEWDQFDNLPARFSDYIAGLRDNIERPKMRFYPGLIARPLWDAAEFPIAMTLEARAQELAEEVTRLELPGRDSDSFRREGDIDGCSWSLETEYGEIGKRIPTLYEILNQYSSTTELVGSIHIDRLGPSSKLAPRRIEANTYLRCQLILRSNSMAGLKIDGLSERLRAGRCVLFDRSFSHELHNTGASDLLILSLDLWHPSLRKSEISLLAGLNRMIFANCATG